MDAVQRTEVIVVAATIMILYVVLKKRRRIKRKRSCWVKPRRICSGGHNTLVNGLTVEDPYSLQNVLRLDDNGYKELYDLVSPLIMRNDTNMRQAIPASQRITVTLRYLASGISYADLVDLYQIAKCTLSKIIPETCAAIYDALCEKYMKAPTTEEEWLQITDKFWEKFKIPNCIGVLDGKHVAIQRPRSSGAHLYSCKDTFSIVLLALVDADYKFQYIDVGGRGRVSEGDVFKHSTLSQGLENGSLNIPKPQPLPGRQMPVPLNIIADEAFPLTDNLQKPYPDHLLDAAKHTYNYQLSEAYNIVENVFGILAARFAIFQHPIKVCPEKAEIMVLACCALHNFLQEKTSSEDSNIDEPDLHVLPSITQQVGYQCQNSAKQFQAEYCDYLNGVNEGVSR